MKTSRQQVSGWCLILGVAVLGVSAEENAVRNPGFEKTDPAGATQEWTDRKPVYCFADGIGRAGSRGLAFNNTDPNYYSFPSQKVNVQPGRCYAVEVWVKTEKLIGTELGATVCMEWSDGSGKHLGGAYPEGVCGTSDGWQKVKGYTGAIPTNAACVRVAPYVRPGMTGKAWFDDLRVTRYDPPLVSSVSASCYRNTSAGGQVIFSAGLALNEAGVNVTEVAGTFVIETADGKPVRTAKPDTLTHTCARLSVNASDFPVGDYAVRFALSTRDGTLKSVAETLFHRVGRLPERKAYIDAHRRLILDGRPFFPLGMYWSTVKETELKTYAKSPFNCLMPYARPTAEKMDACHAYGLKVIYSVKELYVGTRGAPPHMKTEADERAEIQKHVSLFKNHPALLAWYVNDERPLTMLDRLTARQRLMEELDPDHPTWAVLNQYNQVISYLPTCDVVGTDPYPIPERPAGMALQWTRVTRDQTHGTRAMWQVPQVFDWGAHRKGAERERARAPTLQEMRSMAWQCVAAGANGLVFFSFFDLYRMNDRDPFDTRWADVCAMAEEIKRYIPVILSDEAAPKVTRAGPASVETRAWRSGSDVYLLAVNSEAKPVTATVTVAGGCQSVSAGFGKPPEMKADGTLVYTFAPLEPVMARIKTP